MRIFTTAILVALVTSFAPALALAQRSGSGRGSGAPRPRDSGTSNVQPASGPIQPATPGSAYRTSPTVRPTGGRGVLRRGTPYLWWFGWNVGYPDYYDTPVFDEAIAPPEPAALKPPAESSLIQPMMTLPGPQTPRSARGTLQLAVAPNTAQVYVDGFYAGTVEDITRPGTGLELGAGWHRLEFRAPGYATPAVNVTIEANRTLTYRADLQPLAR